MKKLKDSDSPVSVMESLTPGKMYRGIPVGLSNYSNKDYIYSDVMKRSGNRVYFYYTDPVTLATKDQIPEFNYYQEINPDTVTRLAALNMFGNRWLYKKDVYNLAEFADFKAYEGERVLAYVISKSDGSAVFKTYNELEYRLEFFEGVVVEEVKNAYCGDLVSNPQLAAELFKEKMIKMTNHGKDQRTLAMKLGKSLSKMKDHAAIGSS